MLLKWTYTYDIVPATIPASIVQVRAQVTATKRNMVPPEVDLIFDVFTCLSTSGVSDIQVDKWIVTLDITKMWINNQVA